MFQPIGLSKPVVLIYFGTEKSNNAFTRPCDRRVGLCRRHRVAHNAKLSNHHNKAADKNAPRATCLLDHISRKPNKEPRNTCICGIAVMMSIITTECDFGGRIDQSREFTNTSKIGEIKALESSSASSTSETVLGPNKEFNVIGIPLEHGVL